MKRALSALALVICSCGRPAGRTYFIDDSLTMEQRQEAYNVGMEWNKRVGPNGVRNDFVDSQDAADVTISARPREWLTNAINQWCSGVYVQNSGEMHIFVQADAVNFRRILDHEFGHSLGMDHLPPGKLGLMDPGASREWMPDDAAMCKQKEICR